MRDAYPELLVQSNLISRSSILFKLLTKYSIALVNKFALRTTVSKGLLNDLHQYYKHKNVIIYNGYDSNLLTIREKKFDRFTAIFHGTLGVQQNLEFLCNVIQYLANAPIDFMVIGRGPKSSLIKENKSIQYIEDLDRESMLKLISKCHLGLSFRTPGWSAKTALPVKIFEYHGLGLPVVSAPVSEVGKIFSEKNGLFEMNLDVHQVANKILDLLNNSSNYLNNTILEDYAREKQAQRFVQEFKKTLDD